MCTLVTSGQVASNTRRPRRSPSAAGVLFRPLSAHLGPPRPGGAKPAPPGGGGGGAHRARDAVRREDHHGTVGHLVELVDEDRALVAQLAHDVLVVHDLVAHVDGAAEHLERALDDLDRAVDAGAKAAGLGEERVHAGAYRMPRISTSKRIRRPARGWLKSNSACRS